MNKLILAIATTALIAGAGSTFARGHGHGSQHHRGAQMQHMLAGVDATDAQRAQIKSILESNRESMKTSWTQRAAAKRALGKLDPMASNYESEVSRLADQLAEATRQSTLERAAIRSQVAAVLTPEQRATMQAKRAEQMQKRKDRMQKHMQRRAERDAK